MGEDSNYFFPEHVRKNLELAASLMESAVALYKTSAAYDKETYCSMAAPSLERIEENCRRCLSEVAVAVNSRKRICSRSKFLLRLVISRFAHLLKPAQPSGIIERSIIPGVEQYLLKLLGAISYYDLNRHAEVIVGYTHDDGDVLWNKSVSTETGRMLVIGVFGRIIEKFQHFEQAKMTFVSIVNGRGGYFVTDEQFRVMFYYMFNRLYDIANERPEEIDVVLGEGTCSIIKATYETGMTGGAPRPAPVLRRSLPRIFTMNRPDSTGAPLAR